MRRKILGAGTLAVALALSGAGTAFAEPTNDIATRQAQAVETAAEGMLDEAVVISESSSAYRASSAESTVTLSKGDEATVGIKTESGQVNIEIDAEITGSGTAADDRSISYQHENGDASVVNVNDDGGVRVTSLVSGPDSPEEYSYEYPGIDLVQFADGGVVGYDASGDLQLIVDLPWAFDADGDPVATNYTVSGSTLTQHVEHDDAGHSYPIAADPTSYGGNAMYREIVRDTVAEGTVIRVYVGTYNFGRASNDAIYASYRSLVPSLYEGSKWQDQLICHARNASGAKSPWNLDAWRPDVSYAATVLAFCNPN